jgi:hypothetical protein
MAVTNLLPLTGFKLKFNTDAFPLIEKLAVAATFPSISVSEVAVNFSNKAGFVSSGFLQYGELNIRIALDEKLEVYKELFDWLLYNSEGGAILAFNMVLNFLTSHNNVSRSIRFNSVFATSISGVELNTQSTDVEYGYVDVTFKYDNFVFQD